MALRPLTRLPPVVPHRRGFHALAVNVWPRSMSKMDAPLDELETPVEMLDAVSGLGAAVRWSAAKDAMAYLQRALLIAGGLPHGHPLSRRVNAATARASVELGRFEEAQLHARACLSGCDDTVGEEQWYGQMVSALCDCRLGSCNTETQKLMAIAAAGSDRPPPAQAEAWGLMTVCAGLRGDLDEARNGYRSVLSVARLGRGTASKICVGAARWLEAAEAGHPLCAEIYEHLIAQEESQDWETRVAAQAAYAHYLLSQVEDSDDAAVVDRADDLLRSGLATVRAQRPLPEDANTPVVGPVLHGLALIYARRGKPTFAEGLLSNAEGVFEDTRNQRTLDAGLYARLLRDTKGLYKALGREDRAQRAAAKLQRLAQQVSGAALH